MTLPSNRVYHRRFLRRLRQKIINKHPHFPDQLSLEPLRRIRTLVDFDDHYTAPLHGFRDAADYYRQCSSKQFVQDIAVPTLIVNARNDPFPSPGVLLGRRLAHRRSRDVFYAPAQGGHCGFLPRGHRRGEDYWSERVATEFVAGLGN